MAAINTLVARDAVVGQLIKRQNWAQQEPGVIVVFCIVFIVAVGLIALWAYKFLQKRKAAKASVV